MAFVRVTVLATGMLGAVALAGGGAVLGAAGTIDLSHEERVVARPPGAVDYLSCPEGDPLGVFHGGDRVWATGRDGSGKWIAVRSPAALGTRVWLPAEEVDPDDALDDLPVVECGPEATTTTSTPATTGSATTAPPGSTTSTSEPSTDTSSITTTTAPPQTSTTSTVAPATTTTIADDEGPMILGVTTAPDRIWEAGLDCSRLPRESTVSVEVDDPGTGVASVELTWSVGGSVGTVAMTASGDTWSATVGPFAPGTVDAPTAVSLTAVAADGAENLTEVTETAALTLEVCG